MKRREFLKQTVAVAATASCAGAMRPFAVAEALGQSAAEKPPATRADGPFRPTWESLKAHPMPEWLLDAKFGIYAHWGIYSVPAFGNEWYAKRMYEKDGPVYKHHVATYGDPSKFGYKDFIPQFKAERFDPEEWAQLIETSGAKYAGTAVVHHDGFLLWDSRVSRWNSAQMGPKRDLFGDLVGALRRHGLKIIATEHHLRTFNWYLPGTHKADQPVDAKIAEEIRKAGWDLADPRYADFYWNGLTGRYEDFLAVWQAKVRELIDKYQPDVLWFDGGEFRGTKAEKIVLDLLCHYHNRAAAWGKPVEVLNKLPGTMVFNFPEDYGMLTFEEGRDRPAVVERSWIDDMKISTFSWGYIEGQTYKPAGEIIHGLVDRVARGGGLLLSLCPLADGSINQPQQQILREVGRWLKIHGEAIYGTRPWKVAAEGDQRKLVSEGKHSHWEFGKCNAADIRFARAKDATTLYAFCLGVPKEDIQIRSLGKAGGMEPRSIAEIRLLGSDEKLSWSQHEQVLVVKCPAKAPSDHAIALKITFQ